MDRIHAEALRWNEAFTFAAAEYRRLAECLRAAGGNEQAPADGSGDLAIWSYRDNIADTLFEAGVPMEADPVFVAIAENAYCAEVVL